MAIEGHRLWKVVLAAALLCAALFSSGRAEDADQIDGALWKFTLTPVKPGKDPLRGVFRVKGKHLYQKSTLKSKDLDKVIGEKISNKGKVTHVRIDDMRVSSKGKWVDGGLKGKLVLTFNSKGDWDGKFVDSDGEHWEMKCLRYKE